MTYDRYTGPTRLSNLALEDSTEMEIEELLSIDSQAAADAFVKSHMTADNKFAIARIYFASQSIRDQKKRTHAKKTTEEVVKGGAVTANNTINTINTINIIRELLAIADRIHDFGPASVSKAKLADAKPVTMTNTTMSDEDGFITFMSNHKTIQFKNGNVTNPLYHF